MTTTASDTGSAALFIDRFVSATSADDARTSLEQILDGLTSNQIPVSALLNDQEFIEALVELLHTGKHKQSIPVEEGPTLVCRLLLRVVSQQKAREGPSLLTLPSPGRLLETLLDVASADSTTATLDDGIPVTSTFTRVLALQLLMKLCQTHGSMAQSQLIQAPNGLHRLADLLDPSMEDQVRNEALLLAKIVSKWPSCAKVWIFAEMGDTVMKLAMAEGGLTGGGVVVLDCLELLANLVRHEASLADLAWQSPFIAPSLARLLDLRGGTNFLKPSTTIPGATAAKGATTSQTLQQQQDDDDLDDILNSVTSTKLKEDVVEPTIFVPRLTDNEEQVVLAVLEVLAVMLASESYRSRVWQIHTGLCSLVWELALVSPPPPSMAYVCAMPSAQLQQKALETVSIYFADSTTMDRHQGLDRLLYLVCTGNGGSSPKEWNEKMGLSQAALHVIRQTLSLEKARESVLFTLAPPMTEDLTGPPPPTVVQKLLNTIAENLQIEELGNDKSRRINLIGGLQALALFLVDDTSREMMLRLTSGGNSPSLIDFMLESLSKLAVDDDEGAVISSIIRFLCEWMIETPTVVQAILSSTQSTVVGVLAASTNKIASTMTILALGLAMEYMGDEDKCGGWTRSSIMEVIGKKRGGVSANATSLEQFKTFKTDLPWAECGLEWQVWLSWYSNQVLVVRRRIVQELTGGVEDEEEGEDVENDVLGPADGKSKVKSLQRLVSQQSDELEELRQSLAKALATIDSQEHELDKWKRRAESTPTQLDDLLNDYTEKNSDLEKTIESLKADMENKQNKFQLQLNEKDKSMSAIQLELAEWQAREQETAEERDRLRDEMEGLSSAYASLEEEFQRERLTAAASSSTATAAPTGERDGQTAEQPEGEVSEQTPVTGGSTEVSTLRAENARLHNDVTAAGEWMDMAVNRMNGLMSENATLQNELASTREQLTQVRSVQASEENEIKQELRGEQETSRQLRQQLRAFLERIHSIADVEYVRGQFLDSENLSQADILGALDEFDKIQATRNELVENIDAVAKELETLRANAAREKLDQTRLLDAEQQKRGSLEEDVARQRKEWEVVIATKDDDMRALRGQVERLTRSLEEKRTDCLDAVRKADELAETVATLEKQLGAARDDVKTIREREQAEIYKRESTIRELEAKLGHGQGRFTTEDIQARDDEIFQLRAANDAAQDWMGKAVEQHQMLSDQMAALAEDNASLNRQLTDAHAQLMSLKNESSKIQELERRARDLDDTKAQLMTTTSMLATKDQTIEQFEIEVKTLRGQLQHLKWAEEEIVRANDQIVELRSELEATQHTHSELIRGLEYELESAKAQAAELETEKAKSVDDFVVLRSADSRVAELENELAQTEKALRAASESERALRKELESTRIEVERKTAELSGAVSSGEEYYQQMFVLKEMVEKLEAERSNWGGQKDSIHGDNKSLAVRVLELEQTARESQQLLSQLQEAKADLRRDEDIVHQWEERVAELEVNIEALEKQLVEQEKEANNVISIWQDSCATLEKENGRLKEESVAGLNTRNIIAELEAAITEQDKEAKKVISQLQDSCAEFEKEIFLLKEEVNASIKFKERVVELEAAITEQDKEARNVISQLQDSCAAFEKENVLLKEEVNASIKFKGRVAELETAMMEQDKEARNVILQLQDSCAAFEKENFLLKVEANASTTFKERVAELEAAVSELENQARGKEAEMDKAISRWAAMERENIVLKEEVSTGVDTRERLVELEAAIMELEKQLVEQQKESSHVISQWQERCEALEKENSKFQEKCLAMEAAVEELKNELVEQEEDANNVIAQWEQRCAVFEAENARLLTKASPEVDLSRLTELEASVDALEQQLVESQTTISQWKQGYAVTESENAALREQITATNSQEQFAESFAELEATVQALKKQLAEQEREATNIISQLQETCTAFEKENVLLKDEIKAATSKAVELELGHQAAITELQTSLATLENRCGVLDQELQVLRLDKDALLKGVEKVKTKMLLLETTDKEKDRKIAELENQVVSGLQSVLDEKDELRSELQIEQAAHATVTKDVDALRLEITQLTDAKTNLEARCARAEQAIVDLEVQLGNERDSALKSLRAAEETISWDKERLDALGRELEQKERLIESARVDLEQERKSRDEASKFVADNDMTLLAAQEEIVALKADYEALRFESEETVNQWKDRVGELECTVEELENQLEEERNAATEAISRWETQFQGLESTLTEQERSTQELMLKLVNVIAGELPRKFTIFSVLGKELERQELPSVDSSTCNTEDIVSFAMKADAELKSANESIITVIESELTERKRVESNHKELELQRETSQVTNTALQGRIQQLEATLGEKDTEFAKLEEEENSARQKVQRLEDEYRVAMENVKSEQRNRIDAQSICEALQAVHDRERKSLEAAVVTEMACRQGLERTLDDQMRQIETLEQEVADYQSRADMLQIERARIEDALTKEKIFENEQIETWRQECEHLKKEKEMERERLNAEIRQLEEELRQTNDALQAMYTDEVSAKATAAVAEALRNQVEELQARLNVDMLDLAKEKSARQTAEKEAARLKSDLATLLAMDGKEKDDVDMVMFKAADRIQRKERDEIEELRRALARSQQDLASSRGASVDAEERAARARLQASICEQELISTKSDLNFLSQTMEVMRETEETRRASLEYRISALEDDHEVLRRFHADEVESLRNELTQVSLEKDRVCHSLKESEKALSALMFASSQGSEKDGNCSSPKAELMKLKIEKEQMLSTAAEEASNVEKRIREAIGAHASSLEADIILERELRIAAEAALENMKTELSERRNGAEKSPSNGSASTSAVDKMKSELQRCTQEIQKLADENSSLRTELDRTNAEAKATVNKLTEQCRKAQARALKLECDSRMEAEVRSEVTRLRLEEQRDETFPTAAGQNPAEDCVDRLMSPVQAYDSLQHQKEVMQEERQSYLELVAEQEGLLALLAQQDLIKASLEEALLQALGQDAVEEAIKNAEQKVKDQFGALVKVA